MADTIAVMNGGKIEQAGSRDRPLRAPADRVRGQLPRHLEPRSTRKAVNGDHARSTTHDGADLHAPERCGPHGPARSQSACGRRRSRWCPAGERRPGRLQRPARQGRRRRLPGRLDPVRDPDRRRRGAQRVRAEHRAARSPRRSRVGRDVQLAWKPGAHVRGGAWLTAARAAGFLGRAGSLALASSLAGCGIEGTLERAQKAATPIPEITHPKVPIGDWTFSNWPLYIDKKVLKTFDKQLRRARQVRRGHQRQRRVLRQGPPAAAGQPADRARHRGADRLHGGQVGAQPLRPAARQEEHAERRQEPRRQPQVGPVRQEARVHGAVAVGRGRPRLQPEEDRARAELDQRPLRPGLQGPRDDALGAL